MKTPSLKSDRERVSEYIQLIRGKQAEEPLNVAIIGGGKACHNLLKILDKNRLSRLRMNIVGVFDVNPDAPGFRYAKALNLFAASRLEEFSALEGLNLIIELTGSNRVRGEILKLKPSGVSVIDHVAARLLWDLVQIESEKAELERESQRYEERSKKETQVILDSLPYRVMMIDMDMKVERVNETFLGEFGRTQEETIGKKCYEIRYGLDRPCKEIGEVCFLKDRLEEIRGKGVFSTIKEHMSEEGDIRFDVITLSPILDENGEVTHILEASRDVTDRIKLEREVEKSNTFFQNVIQSTVDGIVVVDTRGNVLMFNEGMEELTGHSAKKIADRGHLSSFYDIDVAKENMKKMRSNRHGPKDKLNPTSMTITTKDGDKIPVTLSASIIRIEGKEVGSVGVFRDMREILQMRKELEEAHIQLVQSEKIAFIGRMAAGVAHEINNPLSGIMMYAEMLKENLQENPEHMDDAQEIIVQTLRCKKIVSELLEFSRQSVGKTSSFSLSELITRCLNLLVNQALFQDIEVKMDMEEKLPQMVGDVGQLQQVFTNLFINAVDAMEGKGKLNINVRYNPHAKRFIVRVGDTGPGIPDEVRDKIFGIFFTTKPAGKGTGLGLAISQNIIGLHGGSLRFECPPQGGTIFVIEFPFEFSEPSVEEPVFIGLNE
ncbi:MAG: PAS domain S-box protein [Desulfobacteraceae bacterium]|nr:PAS domain S-box protein [Desulfobacteraceae bacterium]